MMLLTQFVTLGLLTLTTAGGAVGGYLVRSRKEQEALDAPEYKLIEAEIIEEADETSTDEQVDQVKAIPSDLTNNSQSSKTAEHPNSN